MMTMEFHSNADPRDVGTLVRRITATAVKRNYEIKNLGAIGEDSLLLVHPKKVSRGPHLLISAGFHGEEPAGCWGLLHFFEQASDDLLESSTVSFIPIVNPTGIRNGRRLNDWGENPNSGFCHTVSGKPQPSREGRLLLDNLDWLIDYSQDGFLSLHEDIDCTEFYLYTFEATSAPGPFSFALRDIEASFFRSQPDGMLEGGMIRDGIIFKQCDGSFEDLLFHKGVPRTACTETPGKLNFERRVTANAAIAQAFVLFHLVENE